MNLPYSIFAQFYNELTKNVSYARYAQKITEIASACGISGGVGVDLCCGTGSLTAQLSQHGFDMIGVDSSQAMLSVAVDTAPAGCQFISQDITHLDLFGTVKLATCSLDSLNHLPNTQAVREAILKVGLFTEPGGLFIFDVNTLYKHTDILDGSTFIYTPNGAFISWQNNLVNGSDIDITLDFFLENKALQGPGYTRYTEGFTETFLDDKFLRSTLKNAGFNVLNVLDDYAGTPIYSTQRLCYIAQKQ